MPDVQRKVSTRVTLDVPLQRVRNWFLALADHPEWYRFASHEGFVFTDDSFGGTGSQFYTRERFFGLNVKLRFVIAEVQQHAFRCDCLYPLSGGWCRFSMVPQSETHTVLHLEVGTRNRIHNHFLGLPVVYDAIQNQINAEVIHIKSSIEHTYSKGDL